MRLTWVILSVKVDIVFILYAFPFFFVFIFGSLVCRIAGSQALDDICVRLTKESDLADFLFLNPVNVNIFYFVGIYVGAFILKCFVTWDDKFFVHFSFPFFVFVFFSLPSLLVRMFVLFSNLF